jgi:hypothetical protein
VDTQQRKVGRIVAVLHAQHGVDLPRRQHDDLPSATQTSR